MKIALGGATLVECPACEGDGAIDVPVGRTSNPYVSCDVDTFDCGPCRGTGRVPEEEVEGILDLIEQGGGR